MTMRPEYGELLSAFVDGECVDPGALAEALTDPEAAAMLVSIAQVRSEIRSDASQPSPAFYHRMEAALQPRGIRRLLAVRPSVSWPITIGMTAAALATGILVAPRVGPAPEERLRSLPVAGTAPPAAAHVSPRAPSVASVPAGPERRDGQTEPPRFTHLLRFSAGDEWTEGI
jgi:hypothetical protein